MTKLTDTGGALGISGHGRSPRVTVGVPVYNEAEYLSATMECILQQDFSDYEVIIGDNASEDKSGEIVQQYAQNDRRIRHVRHPKSPTLYRRQ